MFRKSGRRPPPKLPDEYNLQSTILRKSQLSPIAPTPATPATPSVESATQDHRDYFAIPLAPSAASAPAVSPPSHEVVASSSHAAIEAHEAVLTPPPRREAVFSVAEVELTPSPGSESPPTHSPVRASAFEVHEVELSPSSLSPVSPPGGGVTFEVHEVELSPSSLSPATPPGGGVFRVGLSRPPAGGVYEVGGHGTVSVAALSPSVEEIIPTPEGSPSPSPAARSPKGKGIAVQAEDHSSPHVAPGVLEDHSSPHSALSTEALFELLRQTVPAFDDVPDHLCDVLAQRIELAGPAAALARNALSFVVEKPHAEDDELLVHHLSLFAGSPTGSWPVLRELVTLPGFALLLKREQQTLTDGLTTPGIPERIMMLKDWLKSQPEEAQRATLRILIREHHAGGTANEMVKSQSRATTHVNPQLFHHEESDRTTLVRLSATYGFEQLKPEEKDALARLMRYRLTEVPLPKTPSERLLAEAIDTALPESRASDVEIELQEAARLVLPESRAENDAGIVGTPLPRVPRGLNPFVEGPLLGQLARAGMRALLDEPRFVRAGPKAQADLLRTFLEGKIDLDRPGQRMRPLPTTPFEVRAENISEKASFTSGEHAAFLHTQIIEERALPIALPAHLRPHNIVPALPDLAVELATLPSKLRAHVSAVLVDPGEHPQDPLTTVEGRLDGSVTLFAHGIVDWKSRDTLGPALFKGACQVVAKTALADEKHSAHGVLSQWSAASQADGFWFSKEARHDPVRDFAEFGELYRISRGIKYVELETRALSPQRYQLFDQLFGNDLAWRPTST
jgi:hypothetical protein